MRVLGLIWWASFLALGLTVRVADAQTSRRVVVIHPPATDDIRTEALTRVQGELTAAGFDVVPVLEKEGTDILSAVEAAMRNAAARRVRHLRPSARCIR